MGYSLKPRNKKVDTYSMGAFSFSWMLNSGVGYILDYGPGLDPGSYIYKRRADDKDIMSNEGAHVTAKEAKEMAKAARNLANYQDMLRGEFDKLDEKTKEIYMKNEHKFYVLPVREDFIQKVKEFADFAEKSGGFKIY